VGGGEDRIEFYLLSYLLSRVPSEVPYVSTFGISPMLALPRMPYIVDALSIP